MKLFINFNYNKNMSKYQISFKILEYKPIIPDINNYYYQIICYETKFKDYIYCSKNNIIIDTTNLKKNLKYIIKLMKKGKILAVGNLIINNEIITKKIKQKKYKNINLFITENNYKKIFPKNDLSKINKYEKNITLSIEVNIKYNLKLKEINDKKLKLIRRNFSYQDRGNNNDYSKKSLNNLTTSTTNINTFNNINNCYDNDNMENNINYFSSEKYIITTPPCIISPTNISSPLSDTNTKNKRKRKIESGLISNISFKNNTIEFKNKLCDNLKYNYKVFDLKNRIRQKSSRNNTNKFLYNKRKINILITQESSSSKKTNTITQSSIINSVLIDKYDNIITENKTIRNNNSETIQNIINNKNTYNKDNDSFELYMKEIENKKNIILNTQDKRNKKLFCQDEKYNKLFSTLYDYENKIKNTKKEINKIKEENELLKYKEEIIINTNKELIPIISKIKESKQMENNIINTIMQNYKDNNKNKKNTIENSIEKYDKNLMIKMLKNLIQSNHNVDIYLKDEYKQKLKLICDKYNIFGSIIEDIEE